jgi:PTH1 family peptidyl-tRNA hydrolase
MKLIVGLGNPEPRYALTRHNAGFWIVDALATKCGARFDLSKDLRASLTKVTIAQESVVLAKPVTYMNDSGSAVQAILHWYKLETRTMLVAYDESALPLGKLRYQKGGGAGGHHGIESIVNMLGGNNDFDRLRFGVGPDPGGDKRADYVLSILPAQDMALRDQMIDVCVRSIDVWLKDGVERAANSFNSVDLRPQPEPPPDDLPSGPPTPAS